IHTALLVAALTFAAPVSAQTTQRIRGTITALDGNTLSVKSRDGKDLKIELTEKASVATVKAMTLADLKPGDYVGSTTRKRADGVLVAVEIHSVPQGVGEGHRPWDLEPDTMMTNANIASTVQAAGGQNLTLEYKGGSQKILVPPGTPIVTTVAADRSFLKPGEYVFFNADVAADGKMTVSGRIQVSKDGVKPPQ
ncbi:MAG TPA: DUF5666 domain-containing protein, partial [Burkholderiales bacterium]|nr:DUF5666 domain-containing protein [Burkholderiales bacterium]